MVSILHFPAGQHILLFPHYNLGIIAAVNAYHQLSITIQLIIRIIAIY